MNARQKDPTVQGWAGVFRLQTLQKTVQHSLLWLVTVGLANLLMPTCLAAQDGPLATASQSGCLCPFPEHCCSDGVSCCRWAASFGFLASSNMPENDTLDEEVSTGLQFGYRFTDRFGLEGSIERLETEVNDQESTKTESDLTLVDLSAVWWLRKRSGRFEPMLYTGVGWAESDFKIPASDFPSNVELDDTLTLNAGGGLNIQISDAFYFRPHVKARWFDQSGDLDWSVGASLGFTFGGRIQALPSGAQGQVVDLEPDQVVVLEPDSDLDCLWDQRTHWSWEVPSSLNIFLEIPDTGADITLELEGPAGIFQSFNASAPPALPQFHQLEVERDDIVAVRVQCRQSPTNPCTCSYNYKITVDR